MLSSDRKAEYTGNQKIRTVRFGLLSLNKRAQWAERNTYEKVIMTSEVLQDRLQKEFLFLSQIKLLEFYSLPSFL